LHTLVYCIPPNPDQLLPEISTVNDSLLTGPENCVDNDSQTSGPNPKSFEYVNIISECTQAALLFGTKSSPFQQ
jgi:hypothetical protein